MISRTFLPTVSYRSLRLLMLCLVVALQAMTPFIHAHAGPAQASHAGWLHGHAGMSGDADCYLTEHREQGAETGMAQAMTHRQAILFMTDADASYPLPAVSSRASTAGGQAPAWPPVLPLHALLSEHALPHAQAPPRR